MARFDKYLHWVFGENILLDDQPTYLINLQYAVCIKFDYADGYFASYEDFWDNVAEVQFLTHPRPNEETVKELLREAWNFLAHFEREEENRAELRSLDDDF